MRLPGLRVPRALHVPVGARIARGVYVCAVECELGFKVVTTQPHLRVSHDHRVDRGLNGMAQSARAPEATGAVHERCGHDGERSGEPTVPPLVARVPRVCGSHVLPGDRAAAASAAPDSKCPPSLRGRSRGGGTPCGGRPTFSNGRAGRCGPRQRDRLARPDHSSDPALTAWTLARNPWLLAVSHEKDRVPKRDRSEKEENQPPPTGPELVPHRLQLLLAAQKATEEESGEHQGAEDSREDPAGVYHGG